MQISLVTIGEIEVYRTPQLDNNFIFVNY